MARKHYLYFMVACALLGSLCACKHKNTEEMDWIYQQLIACLQRFM